MARVPKSTFPWKKRAVLYLHPKDLCAALVSMEKHGCSTRLWIRGMVRQAGTSLTAPWHLRRVRPGGDSDRGSAAVQGPPSLTIETSQTRGQDRGSVSQGSTGSVRYRARHGHTYSMAKARV